MATSGDIMEFALKGYYSTPATTVMNVFQYEFTNEEPISGAGNWQVYVDDWSNQLNTALELVMSQEVQYNSVTVRNLSNPTELYEIALTTPIQGAVVGDALPSFNTWTFLLRRTNTTTRNGSKRFAGVPESLQITNVPTAGALTLLNSLATFLGNDIELAGGTPEPPDALLTPTIVRKDATGAMTLHQPVASAQFSLMGSQNSRKIGRGA